MQVIIEVTRVVLWVGVWSVFIASAAITPFVLWAGIKTERRNRG